jgi:hypothetical protein
VAIGREQTYASFADCTAGLVPELEDPDVATSLHTRNRGEPEEREAKGAQGARVLVS